MPSLSILARCAFVGLVALAEGMARGQLTHAVENLGSDGTRIVVQIAGAAD